MTIALIRIPHQLPARILWFGDREDLFEAAIAHAMESGRQSPTDPEDAIRWVTRDWHGHILIESAADLDQVRNYQGHHKQHVRAMIHELQDEFIPWEPNNDDTT